MGDVLDEIICELNHTLKCGYEIKWSYDSPSHERDFSNCAERPESARWRVQTPLKSWIFQASPRSFPKIAFITVRIKASLAKSFLWISVFIHIEIMTDGPFHRYGSILISIVSHKYCGMLQGHIHINFPSKHPITSFETVEIKISAASAKRSIIITQISP